MKNMLLTTTALIAFAGAAAADGHTSITWSGAATVGVAREGGSAAGTQSATTAAQIKEALAAAVKADAVVGSNVDLGVADLTADTTMDDVIRARFGFVTVGAAPTKVGEADTRYDLINGTSATITAAELVAIRAMLKEDAVYFEGLSTDEISAEERATILAEIADGQTALNALYGATAVATGEFDTYAEVSLTATGSVDLGNGVTVSGAVSVDAGTGYDFADDDGFDAAKTNGVSLDYITVDGGTMGAVTFDKNDIAHLVDGDDDENGDIKYTNTFGNATVAFVMDMSKDTNPTARRAAFEYTPEVEDDATTLADETTAGFISYNAAVAADVAWSAKLGYVINDSMSVYAAFDEGKGNAFGGSYSMNGMTVSVDSKLEALEAELGEERSNTISGSYSVAGFTAGASYNTIKDGNQWGVNAAYAVDGMSVAYSTNEGEEWAATASYAFNEAASVEAGVNYTEDAYVGVSFKF